MKIQLSKTQWEHIGRTAGWDGMADGAMNLPDFNPYVLSRHANHNLTIRVDRLPGGDVQYTLICKECGDGILKGISKKT